MPGVYGGLVVIMIYGIGKSIEPGSEVILTESDLPILTEASEELITE